MYYILQCPMILQSISKALIRMSIYTDGSESSLSAYAPKTHFHMTVPILSDYHIISILKNLTDMPKEGLSINFSARFMWQKSEIKGSRYTCEGSGYSGHIFHYY